MYIKVQGRWCYVYRAIDRYGSLVDVRFSETSDLEGAKEFFRLAKTVTGASPARVTTDGHDSYPRAIGTELDEGVEHRTNRYLNNWIEQDHRGVKGRDRCAASKALTPPIASRVSTNFETTFFPVHAVAKTFQPVAAGDVFFSVASSRSASWKRLDPSTCRIHLNLFNGATADRTDTTGTLPACSPACAGMNLQDQHKKDKTIQASTPQAWSVRTKCYRTVWWNRCVFITVLDGGRQGVSTFFIALWNERFAVPSQDETPGNILDLR
jgi:hypothetical protein